MLTVLAAILLRISPTTASVIAAWVTGVPAEVLLAICERESDCTAIALHPGDASAGDEHWALAVRAGALRPRSCEAHAIRRGSPWSTRGAWGTVAAYTLRYLPEPLDCWAPPEVLDVPIVGALAAAWRLRDGRHPALVRWRRGAS